MRWKWKQIVLLVVFVWLMTGCCRMWKQRGRICSYDLRRVFPEREIISDRVAFATYEYLNLVIGGRVRAVRRPGIPVAWSPDGKALLLQIHEPGSTPIYHLAVIREPDWSRVEYVQRDIYDADANWGPNKDWIVFLGIPDYYTIKLEEFYSKMGMYILNLRSGEKRRIGGGACNPEWSTDGRMVAVVTYVIGEEVYGLRIVDLGENWAGDDWAGPAGERVVYRFATHYHCFGTMASWFPDSRRLLVTDGLKILILNLDDGSTETVYEIDTPRAEGYLRARILPDGQHVVYQAFYQDGWCKDNSDCWHRDPGGTVQTSWCGSDSRCWHHEIMLAGLEEMVWRNITPKVEGYDYPSYYGDIVGFEWWQEH